MSGERQFSPSDNEATGRLFDQDAVSQQEANLSGLTSTGETIEVDSVLMAKEVRESDNQTLDDLEKIWAMEDLREAADKVLENARRRHEESRGARLAHRLYEASIDVGSIGMVVGLAARSLDNPRLAQIGAYALSSAWLVRESLGRVGGE